MISGLTSSTPNQNAETFDRWGQTNFLDYPACDGEEESFLPDQKTGGINNGCPPLTSTFGALMPFYAFVLRNIINLRRVQ